MSEQIAEVTISTLENGTPSEIVFQDRGASATIMAGAARVMSALADDHKPTDSDPTAAFDLTVIYEGSPTKTTEGKEV